MSELKAIDIATVESDFEAWWESDGQYCRAGGGSYEKTFAYRAYEAAIARANEHYATPQHTTIDVATADADGYRNGRASVLDGLRDRILIALRDEDCIDNPSQMTDLVMRAIKGES